MSISTLCRRLVSTPRGLTRVFTPSSLQPIGTSSLLFCRFSSSPSFPFPSPSPYPSSPSTNTSSMKLTEQVNEKEEKEKRRLRNIQRFAGVSLTCFLGSLILPDSWITPNAKTEPNNSHNNNGLNPKEFKPFKLTQIRRYNHNTKLYLFELEDPDQTANLPITSFILTQYAGSDGKPVNRPYTPIDPEAKGVLTLLVKEYPKGVMSKHIGGLKVGDQLEIKGPIPKFPYQVNQFQHIGLLAGGTGLTPCFQLIEAILNNPTDTTKISFVFANNSTKDILLKEQLDSYAKKYPKQFRVVYVIDKDEIDWKGEVGFVNEKIVEKYMPKATEDKIKVFVCGPPPFYDAVSGSKAKDYSQGEVGGALAKLGYTKEKVFKF